MKNTALPSSLVKTKTHLTVLEKNYGVVHVPEGTMIQILTQENFGQDKVRVKFKWDDEEYVTVLAQNTL